MALPLLQTRRNAKAQHHAGNRLAVPKQADSSPARFAPPTSPDTQLEKLRSLLAVALHSNPFYTRKLAPLALQPEQLSVEEYCRRVPFTLKSELVEDQHLHPPYGSNLSFRMDAYTRCHQTSGSKGTPLRWLDTTESWDGLLNNWLRIYEAAGVTRADRLFFAFSFGPFLGFWSAFEAALKRGCFCFPGGAMDTVTRLRAIIDHRITVLCCTPTYALRLAEAAQSAQLDLTGCCLKTIITAGEPGGSIPATRACLEQRWPGARVFDHYGMTEVGPVSYECPRRPGISHVISSAYLPEVIDLATHQPVKPGQTGELVLTTLDRLGSPLLRYRTGDIVRPQALAPCLCGTQDLALAGGILDRTDDMVIVKGVNIFPSAIENLLRKVEGISEYRVVLKTDHGMLEMRLEVEPAPNLKDVPALVRKLEGSLQTALLMRVPVIAQPLGTLPRFEMKAKRWIRL